MQVVPRRGGVNVIKWSKMEKIFMENLGQIDVTFSILLLFLHKFIEVI